MTHRVSGTRVKTAPQSGAGGAAGRAIHNAILLDFPRSERESFLAKLQFASLPARTVLNEIGQPIKFAYFVESGLISIVNVLSHGKSVEVGLTGKEGFVGLPLIVGYTTSPTRAVVQIAATAFKIDARALTSALHSFPKLEKNLQRYSQVLSVQAVQIAACNRLHEVDERLARWLLMTRDRIGDSSFPLTQEFLSHMLGTRRASVTVAAGILQKAGLITYTRGQVKIENGDRLKDAACECYQTINRVVENWQKDSR